MWTCIELGIPQPLLFWQSIRKWFLIRKIMFNVLHLDLTDTSELVFVDRQKKINEPDDAHV